MASPALVQQHQSAHRWWLAFNTFKIFCVTTSLGLLLSFSSALFALEVNADSQSLDKATPLVSIALMLMVLSYFAHRAERLAESVCTRIRMQLSLPQKP